MGLDNNIPEGWRMTFLSDITKNIRRGITPKYCENESIFVINQRCIRDYKVSLLNARFHDLNLKDVSDEKRLRSGDILICSTGVGTLGRVAQYKLNDTSATVDSHVTIVRPKDNIFKPFLGLLLSGKEREIEFLAEGTTGQTELPRTSLGLLSINLPPLTEQKAIAKVLTAFDDKIELLQVQNKTLESMAQTIFKEWFGKYQIGDDLPEGWRIEKLGDVLETYLGGTPSKRKNEYWDNGSIPWINSGEVNNFRIIKGTTLITKLGLEKSATKLLPKGTVVIAITGSTLGQYSILEIESCFNQSVVGIVGNNKIKSSFIYFWIANNIHAIIRNATGGAQQHINKENVNSFEMIIPSDEILNKFQSIVEPMMDKISNNEFEIQSLTKTRNTLLPKLMSGQVRVNNTKNA